MYSIAVIGGGAAGVMAALRAVLNNDSCILFTGNPNTRRKSREFWVSKVENMPGFSKYKKGIVDPNKETLSWIEESPFASNFHKVKTTIESVKKLESGFLLTDSKGEEFRSEYVILCSGVMDVQPEIEGSIKPILPYANMQTVDYCLRCDGHHTFNKDTGVIGHGSGAAWVACMLYERYKHPSMTIFTNGETPEFSDEVMELVELYKIPIRTEKIIKIEGEERGKILKGFHLDGGDFIEVQFSFVSLGMIVYNELATSLGADVDKRGFVTTDEVGQSSVQDFYIAGDLRANKKKQIYTAWDMAVDSIDHINMKIRRKKRIEFIG